MCEVLRTGLFEVGHIFDNENLRDPVLSAYVQALDGPLFQKPVHRFYADAAEHFAELLRVDDIRILREHQLIQVFYLCLCHRRPPPLTAFLPKQRTMLT